MHDQAPHQGVTLSNPALLCHCERDKPAVSRNSPSSSYVMTFTGKAELSLPALESEGVILPFLALKKSRKFIQTAALPPVKASRELAAVLGAGAMQLVFSVFLLHKKMVHLSKHAHQLAESNQPQRLARPDFAAKQSSWQIFVH